MTAHRSLALHLLLSLGLALLLTACGGGGGGGGGGEPPPPGPGPDVTPPTVTLLAPAQPKAHIPGDIVGVRFRANDDREATVSIFFDEDGDLATNGDQEVLWMGTDQNGVTQTVGVDTAGTSVGTQHVFVLANDGTNPAVVDGGTGLVFYPGLAGVAPTRSNAYAVAPGFIAFSVGEAENGNVVLNGDNQADDGVIAFLDLVGGLVQQTSLSVDVTGMGGGVARVLGVIDESVGWHVLEQDQGADMNLDGDQSDRLAATLNPIISTSPIVVPRGGATIRKTPSETTRFVHYLEGADMSDANGDADALDEVFTVFDNTGAFVAYPENARNGTRLASSFTGPVVAFLIDEGTQGTNNTPGIDLNGDGDRADTLLAIGDTGGAPLGYAGADPLLLVPARNIGPSAAFAVSSEAWVGYYIDEAATSPGPMNGDLDNTDFFPAIYDVGAQQEKIPGAGLNAGANARYFFYDVSIAFYTALEEGATDRNGDGDTIDTEVVHWTNHVANPTAANVLNPDIPGLSGLTLDGGSAAHLAPGWLGLSVSELSNATDFTGDGDTGDLVFMLVDASTSPPKVYNTGLATLSLGTPSGSTIPATGIAGDTGVVVQAAESANGGDLNGNGRNTDTLLFYYDFGDPTTRVDLPDTGGFHAAVASGVIGVTANETLTSEDLDGNGSNLDTLFRAFDASGSVLEDGILSTPGSVPATFDGSLWVFLRNEVAEQRDLNDDGDLLDLVMGIWLN